MWFWNSTWHTVGTQCQLLKIAKEDSELQNLRHKLQLRAREGISSSQAGKSFLSCRGANSIACDLNPARKHTIFWLRRLLRQEWELIWYSSVWAAFLTGRGLPAASIGRITNAGLGTPLRSMLYLVSCLQQPCEARTTISIPISKIRHRKIKNLV